ncbi:BRO-N domain-containing protein [Streptacidiphilus carbonis]|uniref:BRO-N domain-containing protein n=1 Tax=Streptacidiphilus carbonis TaxID=105422 RepID=UPI0006947D13|nr:Bro-N domain-containing protein [Streptacidiphilus carbonis]
MSQENSALPEAAPRRDIEIESFAHRSTSGFVRRLTMPDGRWWFPTADICGGLDATDEAFAVRTYVPGAMRTTLGSVCALHGLPIPTHATWGTELPLLSRRGVEALLDSPVGAAVPLFADWVRSSVIKPPTHPGTAVVNPVEPEPEPEPEPSHDAIEISDFVYAATGARIRRLTMPDGSHWFPAADVCNHLGYANSAKTVADHVPDQDRTDLQGLTGRYTFTFLQVGAGRSMH